MKIALCVFMSALFTPPSTSLFTPLPATATLTNCSATAASSWAALALECLGDRTVAQDQRFSRAVGWSKRVLGCNCASPHARANAAYVMSSVAISLDDLVKAERWLHYALDQNPRHSLAHTNLGDLRLRSSRPQEALWQSRRAIIADPDNSAPYFNAGSAAAVLKDWPVARIYFEQATRSGTQYIRMMAHARLGSVEVEADDPQAAEQHYRQALAYAPYHDEAVVGLAQLLLARKDRSRAQEALELLLQARQIHVNHSSVDTQLASAYHELGETTASCQVVATIHEYGGSKDGGFAAARCEKHQAARAWLARFQAPAEPPKPLAVPRYHVRDLSFRKFYTEYALKSKPVVIEGAAHSIAGKAPWTAQHIKRVCGSRPAMLKRRNVTSNGGWAQLEETTRESIGVVIDRLFGEDAESDGWHEFVFDWSISKFCPALVSTAAAACVRAL